ncbi:MAG: Ig-like domain-containing protein, partial [Actinomycetota bacterium]
FDQNVDAGRMSGGIGAYVGVDPADPIDAWAASASETTSLIAPSVDTTVADTTVIRMWGWRGSTADDVGFNVPPTGITQRWSEQVGHVNDDRNRVLAGDHVQPQAGATDTATASGSTGTQENRRNAFTVALAPASTGLTDSTAFDITVAEGSDVNSAPVAADDSASTVADSAVTIDVLANDSDADGDALSVVDVTQPSTGSVVVNGDETVTYTPDAGFTGSDSFTYRASDGIATSDPATVTVSVSAGNTAPVAVDDAASTTVDTAVTVDVLANDSDADGDALSVVDVTQPSTGSVVVNGDETVTYTPDAGFTGSDSFTYRASDGTDVSNVATVTVTVGDEALEQFALTSETSLGSSSGDLEATLVSDDSYQELTEEHTGGPPPSRISRLDHRWTFDVQRGDRVTFALEAGRTSNSEGDDFQFSYSTDGGFTFEPLVLVDTPSDTLYEATLPETVGGTVIVRVIDTDRTQGHGSTDSLSIDYMAIVTTNPQPPLPEVTVEATVASASEDGDQGEFTIFRDDTAGDLTVQYEVSGSATPDLDYQELAGSVTLADGQASAVVAVLPIDDDLAEGSESVVLTLAAGSTYQVGASSFATVAITDNDLIGVDDYATDESTVHGNVVSGDLTSTHSDNDVYEVIREGSHAGGQISRLEHRWRFSVTGGTSVTFFLQAYHTGTEDFMFSYSTDGNNWTDMVQVTKTNDDGTHQEYELPAGVSGTVHVRVVDLDRSKGEPVLDSIFIDEMFFRSQS